MFIVKRMFPETASGNQNTASKVWSWFSSCSSSSSLITFNMNLEMNKKSVILYMSWVKPNLISLRAVILSSLGAWIPDAVSACCLFYFTFFIGSFPVKIYPSQNSNKNLTFPKVLAYFQVHFKLFASDCEQNLNPVIGISGQACPLTRDTITSCSYIQLQSEKTLTKSRQLPFARAAENSCWSRSFVSRTWSITFLKQDNRSVFSVLSFLPSLFSSLIFKYLSLKATDKSLKKNFRCAASDEDDPGEAGDCLVPGAGGRGGPQQPRRTAGAAGCWAAEPGPAPAVSLLHPAMGPAEPSQTLTPARLLACVGCHPRHLPAPLPQGSHPPSLLPDTLLLWAPGTGPCFTDHWSSSGGSFPFY